MANQHLNRRAREVLQPATAEFDLNHEVLGRSGLTPNESESVDITQRPPASTIEEAQECYLAMVDFAQAGFPFQAVDKLLLPKIWHNELLWCSQNLGPVAREMEIDTLKAVLAAAPQDNHDALSVRQRGMLLNQVGDLEYHTGHHRAGLQHCLEARDLLKRHREYTELARCERSLAMIHHERGDFAAATESASNSIKHADTGGDQWLRRACRVSYAYVLEFGHSFRNPDYPDRLLSINDLLEETSKLLERDGEVQEHILSGLPGFQQREIYLNIAARQDPNLRYRSVNTLAYMAGEDARLGIARGYGPYYLGLASFSLFEAKLLLGEAASAQTALQCAQVNLTLSGHSEFLANLTSGWIES